MSTLKRIVKNAGVTFIGNNILKILTMVLVILIARYLGDSEYGKLTFALSFTGLFFVLMDMGTRILIVRDIAKHKERAPEILSNVLLLKTVLSAFVFILIIVTALIVGYPKDTITAIGIAAIGLVFESLSTSISSVFQAYERLEFSVAAKILRIVLRFAFTLPLLFKGLGFMPVLLVYTIVRMIDFIYSIAVCYAKFVRPTFNYDKKLLVSFVKRSIPFFLSGIFATVYFRIDVTLMSKLAPTSLAGLYTESARDAVIGWYQSAYNLLDAVSALPIAFSAAVLPVAILFFKDNKEKMIEIYELSSKYLSYLSIPIAIGSTLVADKVILLLYGAKYLNASLVLKIIIWTLIPMSINYMMGAVMIASHQEKKGLVILFLNGVVNILLNLVLIPRYSLYGAAVATVLTELFYFCGYYYIISQSVYRLRLFRLIIKPVIAGSAMAAALFFAASLNVFALIGLGTLMYTISMFLLRAFSKEDIALFRRSFMKEPAHIH